MVKTALKAPLGTMLRTQPGPSDPILFHLSRIEQAANNSIKETCKRIYNWLREVMSH